MNLPIKVFILVAVAVHFYPSTGFKFTSSPRSPLVVVFGENSTNVTLSWQLTFGNGDKFSNLKIIRLKKGSLDQSKITLFLRDSGGNMGLKNSSLYSVNISSISNGPSTGYVILTIKDIMRQPNNKDGSLYKPRSEEVYVYRLAMTTLLNLETQEQNSETEVHVYFLSSKPEIQPVGPDSCEGKHVNLTCNTTVGNPADTTLTFKRNNQVVKTVHVSGALNSNEAKALVTIAMIAGVNSFTCAANNSAGTSESSAAVNITAKVPPVINCTNNTAVEGTNLVWTCNATGSQTLTTSWFKENNNTVMIASGNTLNISSIKRADAGMYRVTVSNGDECLTASTTVYLTVQYIPGTPTIQVEPVQNVSCEGKHVNLTCNTPVGNPADTTLSFYRNNQVVKTVSGTLNGNEAKATVTITLTEGVNSFTCAANNSVGSSKRSAAVNITAKEPPVITSCTNETALEGTNLVWTCNAIGSQPLTISWLKDNNVVASGNTLNETSIKRSDAGMYRVTVSNGDECLNASTTVYLTVQYPPNITYPQGQDCKLLTVSENQKITLKLVCNASGEPTPTITWTKNGVPLSKQGSPLVLQNVVRNQAGNYTCTADNGVGRADTACWKLDVKFFPDTPTIQVEPGQSVSCEGKNVTFTCNTTVGNPADTTLTFYRNNQVVKTVSGALNGNDVKATVTIALIAGVNSFTCAAKNSAGSSERSAAVIITAEPPVITSCSNAKAEEGTNLVWTCQATGSQPLTFSWFKGNNNTVIASGNTLNISSIKRSDAGMYRFTVSNDECPSNYFASKTVYLTVQYPPIITYPQGQDCKLLTVSENQKITLKLVCNATSEPTPTITWTKNYGVPVSKQGSPLVLQNVVRNQAGNYTCTADNGVGRADTACWKLDVKFADTWRGSFKITNRNFTNTLQAENSSDFKELKDLCEAMLNKVYEKSTDIVDPKVTSFSKGSVIVDYQLTLTANVSDPSLLLKQALNSSGGTLNGLKIDYSSIQAGVYVPPPTTTTTPASTTGPPTTAAVPVTTKPPITIETIIGIVVGAVAFIIIIVVLIVCCCKKKKAKKSSRNGSWNVGKDENNVGMDNRGASPSPSTYARHGPHPSTSTQPTNNNQDNNDVAPTYAQVDINKKTSKKKSGEVTYAALSEFQQSGSETHGKGRIQLEPLPKDKVKMPPKYEETDYAEIVGFQRAREEKKADSSDKQDTVADTWSGSFEITNKEFNNTLQDENSSDFKALKEQCEAMLNQTYENNTVAGEPKVKGFRCLSNDSVIVDYQLTLTANVSDPSLLLKQALNNKGGTLNGLAIDYSSIQAETDEKPKSEETAEKERKEVTPPNLQPSSTQSSETPNSEDTAERGQEATVSSQTSVDSLFTRDRNGTTLTTVSL